MIEREGRRTTDTVSGLGSPMHIWWPRQRRRGSRRRRISQHSYSHPQPLLLIRRSH